MSVTTGKLTFSLFSETRSYRNVSYKVTTDKLQKRKVTETNEKLQKRKVTTDKLQKRKLTLKLQKRLVLEIGGQNKVLIYTGLTRLDLHAVPRPPGLVPCGVRVQL